MMSEFEDENGNTIGVWFMLSRGLLLVLRSTRQKHDTLSMPQSELPPELLSQMIREEVDRRDVKHLYYQLLPQLKLYGVLWNGSNEAP